MPFLPSMDKSFEDYAIVTFTDITRDLIKRIMIENNINIDKISGAYAKKYFLQIAKNYEEAAIFNEKILGAILISVDEEKNPDFFRDEKALRSFVDRFKNITRQDDMLVRWENSKFLLIYLVDSEQNAGQIVKKLQTLIQSNDMKNLGCKLSSAIQKEHESITSLVKKVQAQ